MLYLAADSGMRPQEYIAAARANLKDGGIKVDRALERLGEISVTKTPAGHRFIDLSPDTVDMVQHYVEKHAPSQQIRFALSRRERPLGRSEELDAARLLCRV